MSPEQARGAPVEFRSDQFSFGLMLYELATGAQPFRRDTPVQTLSAIITDEPAAIGTINPRMPAPFIWVVERCLAKSPQGRYGSTQDLARDLHTIRDRLAEATAIVATAADVRRSRRRTVTAFGAVAVGSAAAALVAFAALADPPAIDLSAARLIPLAGELTLETGPVWSPDGKQVAYVGEVNGVTQLFTRRLDSPRSSQLTYETFNVRYPFWSSDMSGVYFIRQAGFGEGLFWVSTVSGQAVSVQQNVTSAALSRDGKTLAMFREEEGRENSQALWTASPPDADPVRYTQPPFDKALFSVTMLLFSPDDTKIGVWAQGTAGSGGYGSNPSNTRFWIVPWPSGRPHEATAFSRLPPSWPFFSWYSDSRHVVVPRIEPPSGSHLWWMDTESDAGQRIDLATDNAGSLDVRPGGETIAFATNTSQFDLVEVPVDGSGLKPLLATPRNEQEPAWSPTGGYYAYVTDKGGNSQIWKRSLDGRTVNEPLVTERDFPGEPSFLFGAPVFSRDGERIAYDRQGAYNRIYISAVAGGQPVPVTSEKYFVSSPTWAPDGMSIGFVALFDGKWELQRSDVGRPSSNLKLRGAVVPYTQPRWSPDSRWIAVLSTLPNGLVLASADPKSGIPEVLVSEETDWLVFGWSRDSEKLYGIRNVAGRMVLVSIEVRTRRETVLNRDLGAVPLSDVPVRGFTWMTPTSFATSIVRVSARIWLLDNFRPPVGRFERLLPPWFRRHW
jgi:Tol biopolymer transport system component